MRALRNFKPDRCYHLISRIANRAFYLTPHAKAGYIAAVDAENLHSPQRKYLLAAKGRRLVS